MKTKLLYFSLVFIFSFSKIHALEITNASLQATASNTVLSVSIYHNDLTFYTTHQVFVEGTVVKVRICYQKTPFNAITEETDNLVLTDLPNGTFTFLVEAYFTNDEGICDYVDLQAQVGASEVLFPLVDAVVLGTETLSSDNDFTFQVVPNPARETVSVLFSDFLSNVHICIYDSAGKQIRKSIQSTSDSNVKLDVRDLKSGLYFISIFSEERHVLTRKLVVVHELLR